MKNTKRSAFTIVELVIVIAVIAILSAVLIPTFGAIIKDANIAADKAAASSLTSELHVYLKGEVIDSEAELMIALNDSGIGAKLTPKSAQYGYHYWFDMKNQAIVCEKSDVVEAKAEAIKNGSTGHAEISGPVLLADVQSVDSVNFSFRDIYGIGWYLIDNDGTLADVISALTNKDMDSESFQKDVLNSLKNYEGEDTLHSTIVNNINTTIIITNNGTFYPEAATQVAVAEGTNRVTDNKHKVNTNESTLTETPDATLPLENGNVIIPDSVDCVVDNSLNFSGENNVNVEINDEKLGSLCASSTNATVNTEYTVEGDKLVNEAGETVKELVSVEGRFPLYDFEIVKENAADKSYEWYNGNLYISYYAFAGKATPDTLQFKVTDGKETAFVADSKHVTWTFENNECGVVISDADVLSIGASATGSATVTATVTLIDGSEGKETFNVYVVKPDSTTVTIGATQYNVPYTGVSDLSFNWNYDGDNGSTTVTLGTVNYVNNLVFANTTPNLAVTFEAGYEDVFTYADGKITLNTDSNGKLVAATKKNADGTTKDTYTITLTLDGCISTTVTAIVRDCTDAALLANFNQAHADKYFRSIGNGNIKLSSLMKLRDANVLPYDSTIVIEAKTGDNWQAITMVEGYEMTCTGTGVTQKGRVWEFKGANWADVTLNITEGDVDIPIRIKITPQTADEGASTITLELRYVNATNVTTLGDLIAKAATESVVLFGNHTVSNSTKIVVGDGNTLYGNGFIITATDYVSNAGAAILTDSLISGTNATIDNIYLDGPVYPVLNYDHNNNGYYVSGISLTGASTVENSYVSGFRQPVCSSGSNSVLTVNNTTLRGGNYANLLLKDGNLNLHNVTTIQDQGGMKATIADDKGNKPYVTGMGIGLERAALDSKITITGYLDQYNWIKNGQTATMPSLSTAGVSLNVNELFGFIFNGLKMSFKIIFTVTLQADMGSVKYFINQDTSMSAASRTDGYVHAGIVFGELGNDAPNWTESVTIDEKGRTDGTIKMRKFDKLSILFSKTGLEYNGKMVYDASKYFNTNGLVVIWSHKDNRAWTPESTSSAITSGHRYVNPTDNGTAKVDSKLPIYQIGDNTDYPINYNGHYKTGSYSSTFNK